MAGTGVKSSDLAGEPVIYQPRHVGRGSFAGRTGHGRLPLPRRETT